MPADSQVDLQPPGSKQIPRGLQVSGLQVPQMSGGLRPRLGSAAAGAGGGGASTAKRGAGGRGRADNPQTHHSQIYSLGSQGELLR